MWTELLTTVLAYAHILSAMGWLGGGILFGFVIAPKFAKLSLPASRDFFLTIQPGIIRFFQVVAGLTVVFGLLLLYVMTYNNTAQLSFSTGWGFDVLTGAGVAVVAFVLSEFVAVPAFKKVVHLYGQIAPDGSNVPAELPRVARSAGMMATVATFLLLVTMGFMVAAGFY